MSGAIEPLLLLTSPLGDDTLPIQQGTLHAIAMEASEQLSRPFAMRLDVVSTERAIDPDELLFRPVCLTIRRHPQSDRLFNGVVRRVEAAGLPRRDRWTYRLEVVPRLWFLQQSEDCRIFQQKSAVEILQLIFAEHQVSPVEFRIFGKRPVREYTTQYNETDLAFAERLLQESGYFYFFEHSRGAHTLVVADRNQAFAPIDHPAHWVIHEGDNADVLDRWQAAMQTACGAVTLQDYDPARPESPVTGRDSTTLATAGAAGRDIFHWSANTLENAVAADRARFRIEADEAGAGLRAGHGYNPEFLPGRRFTLARDPFTEEAGIEHAICSVTHSAQDDSWIADGAAAHYENRFTCVPQTLPWREALAIPRPMMAGVFSAIVLGNAGEEIHADAMGRVKARLLFDHRADTTAAMGVWIRVMQPWSGKGWGWQHLPRVGTEIGVSFMNGDPDTPVAIGCFYNEAAQPPFPIPEQQTRQGLRTRSTAHGGSGQFSELSLDDRIGQERVYVRAQRDHATEVLHDQSLSVGNARRVHIGDTETKTVFSDYSLTSETGDVAVTASAGSVSITATESITLQVAENVITITPALIEILGLIINLTSEGAIAAESELFNITAESLVGIECPGGMVVVECEDFLSQPIPVPPELG